MKIGDNVLLRGTIKGVTYGEYGFPYYLVTLPNGCETEFPKLYIENLQQLDEPQPVKVPQFVADWYEENKDDFEGNLFRCVYNITSIFDGAKLNEFEKWFLIVSTKSFQTLVNMHQFGYEVEEEKRYYVRFKGMETGGFNYLNFIRFQRAWVLSSLKIDKKFRTAHTRKQLEDAGFGWVFDCPGIEIEEVE